VLTVFIHALAADPDEVMDAIITATTTSAKTVAATMSVAQDDRSTFPGPSGPYRFSRSQKPPQTRSDSPATTDKSAPSRALCQRVQAESSGYPVAVKIGGGVVHKTDVGGVRLNICDKARLLAAFEALQAAAPDAPVIIQPMIDSGTELLLRLAALVEDLPEVVELDLNPVVCRCEDLLVVDAKIRVGQASPAPDPALRRLRG
jgi:hypothetical protein